MAKYPASYYTLGPMAQKVWREPWRYPLLLRINLPMRRKLRRALDSAGLITPHFSWKDARCKDGTPVPKHLRKNAIKLAWKLEQLRHALGDVPMPIVSWYRHPAYNKRVGGAVKSQHMTAGAVDLSKQYIDRVGRTRFEREADRIFSTGGVGDYPAGSAHVDVRGWRARWSSFVGQ